MKTKTKTRRTITRIKNRQKHTRKYKPKRFSLRGGTLIGQGNYGNKKNRD